MERSQILKRLALIKHLFKAGEKQAKLAGEISSFSLLQFHDAIEMLLILCSEVLNKKPSQNLLDYWKVLELSDEVPIQKLSRRRRELKHYAALLPQMEVDEAKMATHSFLKTTTFHLLQEDFDTVSLIDLIGNIEARQHVKEAESLLQSGQFNESCCRSAIAFRIILNGVYKSDNLVDAILSSPVKLSARIPRSTQSETSRLAKALESTNKAVNQLQEEFYLLQTGLDYRKFKRFQKVTPLVYPAPNGSLKTVGTEHLACNSSDAQFCIDFVIEAFPVLYK
jgi:hypothetical protein